MRAGRRDDGSALIAMLVIVMICGALAASVIIPNISNNRDAEAQLQRERAFQMAEAGLDWGLAVIRERNGALPDATEQQRTIGSIGQFVVRYSNGTTNSIDDDGDTLIDEADESDFVILNATGTAGPASRTLEVVLRRSIQVPVISGSVQFNVPSPVVDLNGNAFLISGEDHDLAGTVDVSSSNDKAGIASPAATGDIESQIPSSRRDNVVGVGGTPSIAQVAPIDLDGLVDQAQAAATMILPSGTLSGETIGEATSSGVVSAYSSGDLHISGSTSGAGFLVVDGDLVISGNFTWTGIIIVRGRVRMTGGGHTKRVVGGLLIGEEITDDDGETEATVSGNVDLLYSSQAVALASQSLVVMSVVTWNETANP